MQKVSGGCLGGTCARISVKSRVCVCGGEVGLNRTHFWVKEEEDGGSGRA